MQATAIRALELHRCKELSVTDTTAAQVGYSGLYGMLTNDRRDKTSQVCEKCDKFSILSVLSAKKQGYAALTQVLESWAYMLV